MTLLLYHFSQNGANIQRFALTFRSFVAMSIKRRTWSAAVLPVCLKCEVTMYVVPSMVLSLFGGFAWVWPAIGTPPIMRPKLGLISQYDKIRFGCRRTPMRIIFLVSIVKSGPDGGWHGRSIGLPSPHSRGGASYAVTHSRRKYHNHPCRVVARSFCQSLLPSAAFFAPANLAIMARPLSGSPAWGTFSGLLYSVVGLLRLIQQTG